MSSLQPRIFRNALRLPRRQFVCRQCFVQRLPTACRSQSAQVGRSRNYATAAPTSPMDRLAGRLGTKSATAPPSAATNSRSSARASSWPRTSPKGVAYWLLGSAASVFGIVVFGGLTRLTESGLSITEWRPVTGSLPPLSQADWDGEFAKYRASPEFALLNPHMTLAEFKKIYYMEWTHRLWGRAVGLTFVLPTIYLVARRRVSPRMVAALVGISGLIGFQGFIGWWMVRSGLKDDLFAAGSHPRVSQYRLAAHLATAFVCYSAMLLSGLTILKSHRLQAMGPAEALNVLTKLQSPALAPLRRAVFLLTGLIFTTVVSGALVAGLDAGLIYNEFPYMGNGLTPPSKELWSDFYAREPDHSDLWWRNMLENPSLVQLDHRILASTTFTAIMLLFAWSRTGRLSAAMPKDVRNGVIGMVHLVLLQVALGISTLIYLVPVPLAAAHQAGSLALLTGALVLGARMRVSPALLKRVQERALQGRA